MENINRREIGGYFFYPIPEKFHFSKSRKIVPMENRSQKFIILKNGKFLTPMENPSQKNIILKNKRNQDGDRNMPKNLNIKK